MKIAIDLFDKAISIDNLPEAFLGKAKVYEKRFLLNIFIANYKVNFFEKYKNKKANKLLTI